MVGKKSFEQTLVKQIEKLNSLLERKDDLLREVTNENIQIVIINEKIKNAISSINVSMEVIKERINNTNASTIIDGPEAVLNSKELNNPMITAAIPTKIEMMTIWIGLLLKLLAVAAGINSNPVINKAPIIFIEIAITPARSIVKIKLDTSGFIPSAAAKS